MQCSLLYNCWRKRAVANLFHCTFPRNHDTQRIFNLSQWLRVPCWGRSLPQQVGFSFGPTRNIWTCNLRLVWPVTGFVAFDSLWDLNIQSGTARQRCFRSLVDTDRDRKPENMISASDSYTGGVWIMHQMVWRKKAVRPLEQLKVVNDKYRVAMVGHFFHIHYGFPYVYFESAEKLLFLTTLGRLLTSRPATQFAKLPRLILYLDKYRLALSGPISTPLPSVLGRAQVNSFWTTYGKYVKRSVILGKS